MQSIKEMVEKERHSLPLRFLAQDNYSASFHEFLISNLLIMRNIANEKVIVTLCMMA